MKIPSYIIHHEHMIKTMNEYVILAKGAYATDEKSLRERTGLDESCIYHYDFKESNGTYPRPAFYLAVVEKLNALVLSIRGTKTTLEFQIDAKWQPIEFPQLPGSYVHQGIFLSARWFVDQVLGRLVKLVEIFPDYNIRIVGHSLGGGIAALFTLMIKDILPSTKAVIFAPPACISSNLVPILKECCISFVNRSDVLPYLTHANFASIFSSKKIVTSVEQWEEMIKDKLISSKEESKQKVSQAMRNSTSAIIQDVLIQFYPPGDLHHIFKSLADTFHIRRVSHDYFLQSSSISRTIIRHHKMDSYKHAFEMLVEHSS